jgi:hypothetical protein
MRDRFGNLAVFGGEPAPGMMRRMLFCERVAHAYLGRKASANWAEWAKANESESELLNWVTRVADGE